MPIWSYLPKGWADFFFARGGGGLLIFSVFFFTHEEEKRSYEVPEEDSQGINIWIKNSGPSCKRIFGCKVHI